MVGLLANKFGQFGDKQKTAKKQRGNIFTPTVLSQSFKIVLLIYSIFLLVYLYSTYNICSILLSMYTI